MSIRVDPCVKVQPDAAGYVECWKVLRERPDGDLLSLHREFHWNKGTWHVPEWPSEGTPDTFLHVCLSRSGARLIKVLVEGIHLDPQDSIAQCFT